ncbi:MAG: hypothetical protein ISR67_06175 [Sulfurimonas sp.]|nr:hypothetical protein [Sulfurimonas sp.]
MTIKDLEYALWLNGVIPKDTEHILDLSKKNGVLSELIDNELEKLGYDKIFDIEDDFVEDEDYDYVERFPHKNRFIED